MKNHLNLIVLGAGSYAGCCYCTVKGEYCSNLSKMVYLNHRSFLPSSDPLRRQTVNFPSKKKRLQMLRIKNQAYIDKSNEKYDSAKSDSEKKRISRATGCKGSYALRKLPNHDRYLNTPVEPMHLIKNIVEHIVRLLSGLEDSAKVRNEEQKRGRFQESWLKKGKSALPAAPFRLCPSEVAVASTRASSVQVPVTFEWKPRPLFAHVKNYKKMTSHQWKQLISTSILKYTLRGLLGKRQRESLFFFLDVLAALCAEIVDLSVIDVLEYNVHKSLSLLERDFPVSLHVSVFHLLHHLPMYIRRFGPVYSHWMYPYERFNSWIIRRVLNRRYPEATVIETYRLHNWAHHLAISGQLPKTAVLHSNEIEKPHKMSPIVLTDMQLTKLKECYKIMIPAYNDLCDQYDEERRKARVQHQLRRFPASMSDWIPVSGQLTVTEQEMRVVSSDAMRLNRFVTHDVFRREVVFTSILSDTVTATSSYVYTKHTDNTFSSFGRIQLIFSHTFMGSTAELAFVSWFASPEKDENSGILFTAPDYINNSVVPMSSLYGPIVTALDCNQLWILSVIH